MERERYGKFQAISMRNFSMRWRWRTGINGSGQMQQIHPLSRLRIRTGIFGSSGGETKDPVHHNNAAIQNQSRTSEAAIENAKRSDAVRQFAIDWYLKNEVKKQNIQASGEQESYPDYIYDEALYQAILKAEEYLKPFFSYDLDDLYAIEWDSAENGGSDRDKTTLSAEKLT